MLTVAIGSAFGIRSFKQFMQLKVGKPQTIDIPVAMNSMKED
jgi:hypothetical protein